MSYVFYWAPGNSDNYFHQGHYLRLGAFEGQWEPDSVNIEDGSGNAQGIYFHTAGQYTQKATGCYYQAVNGPVKRTIESEDYTYTNTGGDYDATTQGGVKIRARNSVSVSSSEVTPDDETHTSIKIDAGDKDVYYKQGKYNKETTTYKKKIVKAHSHKTNIGPVVKTHGGTGVHTYVSFELGYKTMSVGIKVSEVSFKGLSLSMGGTKNGMTLYTSVGFYVIDSKKVWLDEEFSCVKNEVKTFRFTGGIAQAWKYLGAVRSEIASGTSAKNIEITSNGMQINL
ncbi:hypothetical protein [Roseibium marinum]|uniref:Uncharacterized protein n=1 Tax=Roseibium marinum TaxID=281252 RepID=A0A2S3V1W4_9HYPH|nr:hypothetical protein [Roseibium marinum]POF33773.1 hypothetical protein CLV41_101222 [Roseibium marinum]